MSEIDNPERTKTKNREHKHRPLKAVLSELPSVPERFVFNFSFSKQEHETFGITIVGGKDSINNDGIFIKNISLSGICGLTGNLKIGDQILELNGFNLQDVTHEEAVELFRQCKTNIHLVVSRLTETKPRKDISPLTQYHGRLIETTGEGIWAEEPFMLEHKEILINGK